MKSKENISEKINIEKTEIPEDYHCDCKYCQKFLGVLKRKDGSYYSKLERRRYYDVDEQHLAKTPLHGNRWCIQEFSKEDEWIFDPTIGTGTTAVEALRNNRKAAGIEIEEKYFDVINKNLKINNPYHQVQKVFNEDARNTTLCLEKISKKPFIQLVMNNPPYSGDFNQPGFGKQGERYSNKNQSLAYLKEGEEYYRLLKSIYQQAINFLKQEGYFCIMVKDMVRNKKPYLLHKYLAEVLEELGLKYQGMALLPHWPPTLFMNTYQKQYPEVKKIPLYQTIIIFKKEA